MGKISSKKQPQNIEYIRNYMVNFFKILGSNVFHDVENNDIA